MDLYQLVAIGWGQKAENVRETSAELQQVTLHTIAYESESCRVLINSKTRQFCAGVEMGGKGKNEVVTDTLRSSLFRYMSR